MNILSERIRSQELEIANLKSEKKLLMAERDRYRDKLIQIGFIADFDNKRVNEVFNEKKGK